MVGASELIFLGKTIPKIVKIFRPAAPKWGRRPSFDLRRAPQAGSGGVEAFLGENCPNPRDLSATSPAPKAFLAVPQHVIFAFRFQNELARVFFWGQNELAQFSSEGGFELALFFFWADFGFFLGPFRASSVSWLYRPGAMPRCRLPSNAAAAHGRKAFVTCQPAPVSVATGVIAFLYGIVSAFGLNKEKKKSQGLKNCCSRTPTIATVWLLRCSST